MEKYLLVLVFVLFLSGCNKEAEIQEEVTGYINQAEQYREDGKLDDAISLYNKALEIKEDSNTRGKLRETESEKETVEKVQSVLDIFQEVDTYYLQDSGYISPVKIKEATDKLRTAIDELHELKGSENSEIDLFVKEIKDSSDYRQVKQYVESNVADDSDTMEDLAFVSQNFQVLNEIGSGMFEIMGRYVENIAKMEIPNKY